MTQSHGRLYTQSRPTQGTTIIRAARAIVGGTQASVSIVVAGGVVLDVTGNTDPGSADVVEYGTDVVLMPGLVDCHVHVNEPGRTEWEGFESATAAAAAGGVTTIVDMPLNSVPATVDTAALAVKRNAAQGKLAVDVAFWGGAVPGNAGELAPMHRDGVVGFKCFLLPSGVAEFPPLSGPDLVRAMEVIAGFGGLLIAHAEDHETIEDAAGQASRAYQDFVASRPDAAEHRAVTRLIEASRRTGCRVHVVHLSSSGSIPLVRSAKNQGIPMTAETCPHYLDLTAESVPDGATQFKCCPPIRSRDNREALWDALLDGTIDCVVSDHSPCTPDLKRLETGDFTQAWGGISSLQLALPVVWSQARARAIGPERVAQWMSTAPASLAGLSDRGAIAPGKRADFCVLDPEATFTVRASALKHRNQITPYEGRTLHGTVREAWLAGSVIEEGKRMGRMVTPC
jgi:allantoinase